MTRKSIRTMVVAGAAALLIGGMTVSPAWAYFTDSHGTAGGIRISVEPKTDIEEEFDNSEKHVYIKNTSYDCPVFVRARVYTNAPLYLLNIAGANWSDGGDDWWYWNNVLEPIDDNGTKDDTSDDVIHYTDKLDVKIDLHKTREVVKITNADGSVTEFTVFDHTDENYNVIVVYEAVPIQFDASGNLLNPQAADWTMRFKEEG